MPTLSDLMPRRSLIALYEMIPESKDWLELGHRLVQCPIPNCGGQILRDLGGELFCILGGSGHVARAQKGGVGPAEGRADGLGAIGVGGKPAYQ